MNKRLAEAVAPPEEGCEFVDGVWSEYFARATDPWGRGQNFFLYGSTDEGVVKTENVFSGTENCQI